jgi:nitrate/nitrite transporter NarK
MIVALGSSMSTSASVVALNSYFKKKIGPATGISMMITGIGPIFVPQIISFLLSVYSNKVRVLQIYRSFLQVILKIISKKFLFIRKHIVAILSLII